MQHTAPFQRLHRCHIWSRLITDLPKPQNRLHVVGGWTYRLSLVGAFVAHKRALLITDQAADPNALGQPMFDQVRPLPPYTWEENAISGRTVGFIWRNFKRAGSHHKVLMFIKRVREPF